MAVASYNGAALTLGTAMADIYQAPVAAGNIALVTDLRMSNASGTASSTVQLVKTSSANTVLAYIVAKNIVLPIATSLVVVQGGLLVLKAGEKIRGLASVAGAVDVNISVREEV
jgi:hypothetical protein